RDPDPQAVQPLVPIPFRDRGRPTVHLQPEAPESPPLILTGYIRTSTQPFDLITSSRHGIEVFSWQGAASDIHGVHGRHWRPSRCWPDAPGTSPVPPRATVRPPARRSTTPPACRPSSPPQPTTSCSTPSAWSALP